MKKFLSLVLALVMAMSLVTIGAGATSFSDDDTINYDEAISVMNAVGVVTGYSDGSFRPEAVLTRGAASKIICNMLLGSTSAAALSVSSAPFPDVAADSTFAGYIAYMVKEGIVSGYSDGTFRPGANLTGYAFMKMLLTALGYDAKREGYVGANWSVAVAKRALSEGLADNLLDTFNGLKPVTRQEACLYAFNTLQAPMVTYGITTSIVAPGVNVTSSTPVSYTAGVTTKIKSGADYGDGMNKMELGEKVFTNLQRNTGTYDDFKHPTTTWKLGSKTIGEFYATPVATFTHYTKKSAVATALSGYTFRSGVSTSNYYKVADDVVVGANAYVNKADAQAAYGYKGLFDTDGTIPSGKTTAEYISDLTASNKAMVEVFANSDDYITHIIVTPFNQGEVTRVSTNSKGNTSYTIKDANGTTYVPGTVYAPDAVDEDDMIIVGTVKAEDIVTYVKLNNGKTYVYPTTKTSGTASKISGNEITLSGEKYYKWDGLAFTSVDSATDFYLDFMGNICKTSASKTSDIYYFATYWNEGTKGTYKWVGQLVNANGTVEEVALYDSDTSNTTLDTYGVMKDTMVTKASVGGKTGLIPATKVYLLTDDVIAKDAKRISYNNTSTYYYINNDVKITFIKDAGDELVVNTVSGMQKLAGLTDSNVKAYAVLSDTTAQAMVKYFVVIGKTGMSTSDDILFLADDDTTADDGTVKKTLDKAGKETRLQTFYNGTEDDDYMVGTSPVGNSGFYSYAVEASSGRYSMTSEYSNTAVLYFYNYAYTGGNYMNLMAGSYIHAKTYMNMFVLDGAGTVGTTEKEIDASKVEFIDLTGNDVEIHSVGELYEVMTDTANYSTNLNKIGTDQGVVVFALFNDDNVATRVYLMRSNKVQFTTSELKETIAHIVI